MRFPFFQRLIAITVAISDIYRYTQEFYGIVRSKSRCSKNVGDKITAKYDDAA